MNKVVHILALLNGTVATASAQQVIPVAKRMFLDSAFRQLPSEAGARYHREIDYTDSVGGTVKTFFLTGKQQSLQSFEHIRKGIPNGVFETWFTNGQLSFYGEFRHGRRVGELRTYYPSGQLKRREVYDAKDDFISSGECFREDGRPVPFFKLEQMPVYSEGDGGNRAIITAIQRGIKYPSDALKTKQKGRVLVSFTVTNTGEVADIKLVQGIFPSLDEAVLEAVRRLKPFTPGKQDGEPVAVSFTVPITFAIQ